MTDFERDLADRYFEDYAPGIDVRYGATEVLETDVLRFAREFDPQSTWSSVGARVGMQRRDVPDVRRLRGAV